MEKIIEQIKKIRDINENSQLVIFVGAGVSKNSGVCSWWELVKEIADKIDYNKCDNCSMKTVICGECGEQLNACSINNFNCENKYNFSSDDFLIIPQHYYEKIKNDNGNDDEYYNFLKEKFCKDIIPNPIDELIISLNPEHIITTNYDHLLEEVQHPNRAKYTVIKDDNNMLSKPSKHYIIKMHGDIDEIKNVVLKEEDYLKYSQKHVIIETYIKSLLVDKTFLFVGYSLNDNNLKLIMSYIDYFVKENKITERPPHYLVVNEIKNKKHDILYWENKGVKLVDLSKINDVMLSNSSNDSIINPVGKRLYAFLNYIKNKKLPFFNNSEQHIKDNLIEFMKKTECFNFLSYKPLISLCGFKSCFGIKTPLLTFNDENEYECFKVVTKDIEIRKLFFKARIYGAQLSAFRNNQQYIFSKEDFENNNDDDLFSKSLIYKYEEIIDELSSCPASSKKAYYYSLIKYTDGLQDIFNDIERCANEFDYGHLTKQQYYDLSIYEFNNICCRILNNCTDNSKQRERLNSLLDNAALQSSEYKIINDFMSDDNSTIQEMNKILKSHEEYYMKKNIIAKMGGTIHGELYNIQQEAYNYYLFYKFNNLMLDWFNNVEKMVTPYIRAILCTYYPDEYQANSYALFNRTYTKPYCMQILDIDMLVKHIKYKDFKNWITYYKVFSIKLADDIDIAELFYNFCISMKKFWNINLPEHLKVFSLLLSLVELTFEQKERIVQAFITLISSSDTTHKYINDAILLAIWNFVNKHFDSNLTDYKTLFMLLIDINVIRMHVSEKNIHKKIFNKFSNIADEEIYKLCCDTILCNDNKRDQCYFAYVCSDILMSFNPDMWKNWILENIDRYSMGAVFDYLSEKKLTFNEAVKNFFKSNFFEFDNEKQIAGVRKYPDYKNNAIIYIVILLLGGYIESIEDIDFLERYSEENDYLNFLFNPDSFDYSKISTADTMWCNIINNEYYRKIILPHKSEFWTKDDEKRIELGFGDNWENRIVYKYLIE